jgi:uncharacterized protein
LTATFDSITDVGGPDEAAFWNGVSSGVIALRICERCGTRFVLPIPACPDCGSQQIALRPSIGEGTLYTWVVAHHPFDPDLRDDVPYVVGVIELEHCARIFARIEGVPIDELTDGLHLLATFPTEKGRPPIVFVPAISTSTDANEEDTIA